MTENVEVSQEDLQWLYGDRNQYYRLAIDYGTGDVTHLCVDVKDRGDGTPVKYLLNVDDGIDYLERPDTSIISGKDLILAIK